jgi:hypothetical protein
MDGNAVVDMYYGRWHPCVSCTAPLQERYVGSPILAAAVVAVVGRILTSDGLISIRSPSCMAIPLRTVEVGNRPNDYFVENLAGYTGGTLDCGLGVFGRSQSLAVSTRHGARSGRSFDASRDDTFGANGFHDPNSPSVNASF